MWRSLCPGSCNHGEWDLHTHPSPCCRQTPYRSGTFHPGPLPSLPAVQSAFPPDSDTHTHTLLPEMGCDSRSVLLIAWVRLDVMHNLRGLRMTDFNSSMGVEPIGPLTSSHKRKNLHSFQSQGKEGKHFWVFPWQPQQTNMLKTTTSAVVSFFFTAEKSSSHSAASHSSHSDNVQVR